MRRRPGPAIHPNRVESAAGFARRAHRNHPLWVWSLRLWVPTFGESDPAQQEVRSVSMHPIAARFVNYEAAQ